VLHTSPTPPWIPLVKYSSPISGNLFCSPSRHHEHRRRINWCLIMSIIAQYDCYCTYLIFGSICVIMSQRQVSQSYDQPPEFAPSRSSDTETPESGSSGSSIISIDIAYPANKVDQHRLRNTQQGCQVCHLRIMIGRMMVVPRCPPMALFSAVWLTRVRRTNIRYSHLDQSLLISEMFYLNLFLWITVKPCECFFLCQKGMICFIPRCVHSNQRLPKIFIPPSFDRKDPKHATVPFLSTTPQHMKYFLTNIK